MLMVAILWAGVPLIGGNAVGADRELDAHVHGVGTLNIAIEGNGAQLELTAPAADIVGFEHDPATDDERAAIAEAAETLEEGAALFVFPTDAGCVLEHVAVASELMEDDAHGHSSVGHEESAHDREDGAEHSEFRARYRFECAEPDALDAVTVTYFDRFPGARELDARAITPAGQTAATLTSESHRLRFQ